MEFCPNCNIGLSTPQKVGGYCNNCGHSIRSNEAYETDKALKNKDFLIQCLNNQVDYLKHQLKIAGSQWASPRWVKASERVPKYFGSYHWRDELANPISAGVAYGYMKRKKENKIEWLDETPAHPTAVNGDDENEPYFGWCDVEGCENESCSGGNAWRDTGYWKVCYKHSDQYRQGLPQPKMKQKSIDRENSRGKDGVLPKAAAPKADVKSEINLVDVPKPMGDFILDQEDIHGEMGGDGMYYHYKDVVTLLSRFANQFKSPQASQ